MSLFRLAVLGGSSRGRESGLGECWSFYEDSWRSVFRLSLCILGRVWVGKIRVDCTLRE